MNKRMPFSLLAVFNIVALSILTSMPVNAYTYHGAATSWDRGDFYMWIASQFDYASAQVGVASGEIDIWACGWAHSDGWLNSEAVKANGAVNHVTVGVHWTSGYKYTSGVVNQARMEVKLYVNGNYIGTQTSSFPAASGSEDFTFWTNIPNNADLDVDIKLIVDVGRDGWWGDGEGSMEGIFNTIVFETFP